MPTGQGTPTFQIDIPGSFHEVDIVTGFHPQGGCIYTLKQPEIFKGVESALVKTNKIVYRFVKIP